MMQVSGESTQDFNHAFYWLQLKNAVHEIIGTNKKTLAGNSQTKK